MNEKTAEIVQRIQQLQTIQKTNPPASAAWQRASAELATLFDEMARRQADNGGERDWRRWAA